MVSGVGWTRRGPQHSQNPCAFPAPVKRSRQVGLEDKDSLWAPLNPRSPLTQYGHRCGMKLLRQVATPSFPWAGLKGRGLGKGPPRQLPTSQWAAVYTQAMSWLLAFLPAHLARCARRSWLAPAWLKVAFNALALLDLGTRMDSWRRMTPDLA